MLEYKYGILKDESNNKILTLEIDLRYIAKSLDIYEDVKVVENILDYNNAIEILIKGIKEICIKDW